MLVVKMLAMFAVVMFALGVEMFALAIRLVVSRYGILIVSKLNTIFVAFDENPLEIIFVVVIAFDTKRLPVTVKFAPGLADDPMATFPVL